jgi:uncharacterized protein DUF6152
MSLRAIILAGAASTLVSAPAFAHHSFAIFDQSKVNHLTGTVKDFELVNPHAWLHLNIGDGKGGTAEWSFEGGSVAQLVSLGWSKDSFKIGEKVDVGFRPMKDGSRGGQIMSVTMASGKKVCSNRGCGDGTPDKILAPF